VTTIRFFVKDTFEEVPTYLLCILFMRKMNKTGRLTQSHSMSPEDLGSPAIKEEA
jgi:hypothetical protein